MVDREVKVLLDTSGPQEIGNLLRLPEEAPEELCVAARDLLAWIGRVHRQWMLREGSADGPNRDA